MVLPRAWELSCSEKHLSNKCVTPCICMSTFKNNHNYIYILQEFQDVNKKARRVVNHSEDLWWKPPDYGLYKINFDGAQFVDQASAGLGVVIRDWEGQIIAALS